MIGSLLSVLDPATARAYRRQVVRGAIYAVLEGVSVGLTLPVIAAVVDGEIARATGWFIALTVATAATLIAHAYTTQKGTRATFDAMAAVQEAEVEHIRRLPLDWFTPTRNAEAIALLWPGSLNVTRNVLLNIGSLARGVITPVIVIGFAAFVNPLVALVMMVSTPALYFVYRVTSRRLEAAERTDHASSTQATARIIEYAESQPTLRTADPDNIGMALLNDALDDLDRAGRRGVRSEIAARAGFGTAVNVVVAVVVAVIGVALLDSASDVAVLVALSTLALRFAEPIMTVSVTARMLRTSRATVERTVDFLTTDPPPEPGDAQHLPPGDALAVRLHDVHFSYPGTDAKALDGIDLDVAAGSIVAIVGPSGAGKSTLLRLIPRFADPDSGTVLVGGIDVRELDSVALRARVGLVLPEVVLVDRSVRDNVMWNVADANQDDLDRVAEISGLGEVIDRLPGGWDAPVGPQGANLSGGERQRVQIARVALQDPSVVVLDEATAALDPISERIVAGWIDSLTPRCTVIVVAHRLHTITGADRVVVVDDGRVVESGTPDQLARAGGRFQRLLAAQSAQPVAITIAQE